MRIKNIKITNFKSIYGTQEFDFEALEGLVRLDGPIGSGKTSLIEGLQYGLLGTIKGQTNSQLIAWNTKDCEVELNLVSKNKEVHIVRSTSQPLVVEVNDKPLSASNKRNLQAILEEEIYDIPVIAITKMCLITFNGFSSMANMTPAETKQFLDDIFGFKLFTDYNDIVVAERKAKQNESIRLNSLVEENTNQIMMLKEKKEQQQQVLSQSIDLDKYNQNRNDLIEKGKMVKAEMTGCDEDYKKKEDDIRGEISVINSKYSSQEAEIRKKYAEIAESFAKREADVKEEFKGYTDTLTNNEAKIREEFKTVSDSFAKKESEIRAEYNKLAEKYDEEIKELNDKKSGYTADKAKYLTLGKQEKEWYAKFKEGICPTCGSSISGDLIEEHKAKMYEYAELYKRTEQSEAECDTLIAGVRTKKQQSSSECDDKVLEVKKELRKTSEECDTRIQSVRDEIKAKNDECNNIIAGIRNEASGKSDECNGKIEELHNQNNEEIGSYTDKLTAVNNEHRQKLVEYQEKINDIKSEIYGIDAEITKYNNSVQLINENYEGLIKETEDKLVHVNELLEKCTQEICEWNEMNELFTKTLRYKLLNTLIPHINKSIQYYINKLDQPYQISYDQEFKIHLFVDSFDKEITYSNLSTGQKKTVDLAIIFGILQNLIANVDCNIVMMDELMANMDADSRNILIDVLQDSIGEGKCIFIINHADVDDEKFQHRINVKLVNKEIELSHKKGEDVKKIVVRASKYKQIF